MDSKLQAFTNQVMVRIDNHGKFWLMNKPEDGWNSFGYPVIWSWIMDQLPEWKLGSELGEDQHGRFMWLIRQKVYSAEIDA